MLRRDQVLVAAMLLCAPLEISAQTAPGVRRPGGGAGMDYKDYDAATLERGKTAFVSHCGFCHGSNAKGGESGPDLVRSVQVIDDENGNLIGPVVRGGRQAAGNAEVRYAPMRSFPISWRFCMRASARPPSAALTKSSIS